MTHPTVSQFRELRAIYVTNYGEAIIMTSAVLAGEEGGRKRE